MEITAVRIYKTDKPPMKAVATITIGDAFVVHGLRVIEGREGLFVAMPSRKLKNDTFVDIAHPINSDARQLIQTAVLEAFQKAS